MTVQVGAKRICVRRNPEGLWDWKVDQFTELSVWQEIEWGYQEPARAAAIAAARWHIDTPPGWEVIQ